MHHSGQESVRVIDGVEEILAERGGFEPPVPFPAQLLSRQPCSTTPAPLRMGTTPKVLRKDAVL